jgi:hypothetical protein
MNATIKRMAERQTKIWGFMLLLLEKVYRILSFFVSTFSGKVLPLGKGWDQFIFINKKTDLTLPFPAGKETNFFDYWVRYPKRN